MPQPGPQAEAIRRHTVDELFYGGAVGGGKSDYLLGDFAQDVPQVWGPHWHGILFRRTYGELEELMQRAQEIYPLWFPGVVWKESDKTWLWPNGATLKMRYLEHSTDWMRYWGHQFTWIGWDELPSWPDLVAYHKMKARLRSAHPVPNKRIRSTGNPGGPSQQSVKEYFRISQYPMGGQVFVDDETNTTRLFIRARLENNRILLENDPNYAGRLKGLGSTELVRAWLDGDWDAVLGAYFDCWVATKHVIRPVELPAHWLRFMAFDWGSAEPFSVGWYAVASERFNHPDGQVIPAGALIRYREWYGSSLPNVGLKLPNADIGRGILEREAPGENIAYRRCDPSIFNAHGGPSIAEQMVTDIQTGKPIEVRGRKLSLSKADNTRTSAQGNAVGWGQVRSRLVGFDNQPMLYIFSTGTNLIRTIPALQHNPDKAEDILDGMEDHAPDELRYACNSRPWLAPAPAAPKPITMRPMTFNEARDWKNRQREDD